MIDMKYRGRLGNRMIQYSAANVLAKKTEELTDCIGL